MERILVIYVGEFLFFVSLRFASCLEKVIFFLISGAKFSPGHFRAKSGKRAGVEIRIRVESSPSSSRALGIANLPRKPVLNFSTEERLAILLSVFVP